MKRSLIALAIIFVMAIPLGQMVVAAEKVSVKKHEMTVEVVSVDLKANTLTFKNDMGKEQTAQVLAPAQAGLKNLKAAEMVTLTCQDNEKGAHTGISAIKPAKTATS